MSASFQITYALTSDGRDEFADMALVSLLSARLSNPSASLRVLADETSAAALQTARHSVIEVCDDLTVVVTPDGSPVFKNRWLKTQAAEFVDGDFLLLDCDTIVAGDLSSAWPLIRDVGLVANHNAPDLDRQIWREDLDFLHRMGWPTDIPFYANSGAIFFRSNPAVRNFSRRWHTLWQQGAAESGRLRDQPACNAALRETGVQVSELPQTFNCQVANVFSRPGETPFIWHFYSSQGGSFRGHYAHLLSRARRSTTSALKKSIRRAIDRKILAPDKPARHGIRFKPAIAKALDPARGRNIALLLSTEYEGIYRNGGIGTYYREISRIFRDHGWVTILLNLGSRPKGAVPDLPFLDHVFHADELGDFMELGPVNDLQLACARSCYFDTLGTKSLFFIQAISNTFPGQKIYAEFHEMSGPAYHATKARESGWLNPEVVVAVTMHSGNEWIYEANDAILSQENRNFLNTCVREEDSFRSADLAIFPSDALHGIVESYGWRTEKAVKLPYTIPRPDTAPRPRRPARRTMMIVCGGGLANRLSSLASGYWLARFFGLKPAICWQRDAHCDCPLSRLFNPPEDVEVTEVSPWDQAHRALLRESTIISHLPIQEFPCTAAANIANREHLQRLFGQGNGSVFFFDHWIPPWLAPTPALRLFERDFSLEAEIRREANSFADLHKMARRAAVHIRLTDFGPRLVDYSPAVEEAMAAHPDEPVFLCSDSKEAEKYYLQAFPRLFVREKKAFVTKLDPSAPWFDPEMPHHSNQRYNVHRSESAVIEGLHDLCQLATAGQTYTTPIANGLYSSFLRWARLWNPGLAPIPACGVQGPSDLDLLNERHFRFPPT